MSYQKTKMKVISAAAILAAATAAGTTTNALAQELSPEEAESTTGTREVTESNSSTYSSQNAQSEVQRPVPGFPAAPLTYSVNQGQSQTQGQPDTQPQIQPQVQPPVQQIIVQNTPVVHPQINSWAVTSLVLSLVGIFLFKITLGIISVCYANKVKSNLGYFTDKAKAGYIIGIIDIIIGALTIITFPFTFALWLI